MVRGLESRCPDGLQRLRIGSAVLVSLLATTAVLASAQPEGPPTYQHAQGVTFEPVATRAVRLEAQLADGYSGGILEWRIE